VPELPEVTVISEDIRSLAGGREVLRAGVFRPDVTNVEPEEFTRRLVGRTLRGTERRGKITLLDFGDVIGVVHLVISGRVLRLPAWTEPDRMNTAVLEFEGGLVLAFTRLWLGYFHLYEPATIDEHPLISRLGPDPFSDGFTPEYLANAFERKASVKGLLLDQSVVAGLGNIYVDEVLWVRKRYSPSTPRRATSSAAPSSCGVRPSTPTTTRSARAASTSTSSRSSPARAGPARSAARK
jgi:formamidopyrimidine-DNA glycosylase